VEVAGVRRTVNIGLLDADGDGAQTGDWVLIHVGFALSKVDDLRDLPGDCQAHSRRPLFLDVPPCLPAWGGRGKPNGLDG
jgi:hypothetical protein